jgi:hypothetical protein
LHLLTTGRRENKPNANLSRSRTGNNKQERQKQSSGPFFCLSQ